MWGEGLQGGRLVHVRGWAFQEDGRGQEVKGRIREVEGSRESARVL